MESLNLPTESFNRHKEEKLEHNMSRELYFEFDSEHQTLTSSATLKGDIHLRDQNRENLPTFKEVRPYIVKTSKYPFAMLPIEVAARIAKVVEAMPFFHYHLYPEAIVYPKGKLKDFTDRPKTATEITYDYKIQFDEDKNEYVLLHRGRATFKFSSGDRIFESLKVVELDSEFNPLGYYIKKTAGFADEYDDLLFKNGMTAAHWIQLQKMLSPFEGGLPE